MSLFTRVDAATYLHAKGGCYVYGTPGPGVQSDVMIEGEGLLFLSDEAIREMAETAGFAVNRDQSAEIAELKELLRQTADERDAVAEELLQVQEVMAAAGSVMAKIHADADEDDWTKDPQ